MSISSQQNNLEIGETETEHKERSKERYVSPEKEDRKLLVFLD